jgi:hypothetical protein
VSEAITVQVDESVEQIDVKVIEVQVGPAGTLTIGEVVALGPDEEAYVENVGTPSGAILNIGLPKGEKGEDGEPAYRPKSPVFSRSSGKLVRVDYEDGAYKLITRAVITRPDLSQVIKISKTEFYRPGHPMVRKTFNRDAMGVLLSITEVEVAP